MIEATIFRLKCDQCHREWVSPTADTVADARRYAAAHEWTQDEAGRDYGPRCSRHRAVS